MTSNFFDSMGIGGLDIGILITVLTLLFLILFIVCISLIIKVGKLKKKYEKFMTGKDAKTLEQTLIGIIEDNKFLKVSSDKNKKDIRSIYKNLEITFQKMAVVKYDAFNTMGGKLSFSLAMLDGNNDGFIINSVHSSDGCYTYTKVIKAGICDLMLGDEEKKALDQAMGVN